MNSSWSVAIAEAPMMALLAAKLTMLLAGAWMAHFALARVSPRWRVLLWRMVVLGVLALPLVASFAPALRIPLLPALRAEIVEPVFVQPLPAVEEVSITAELGRVSEPIPTPATSPAPEPISPITWVVLAWGTIVLLWSVRFGIAQYAMSRVIRRAGSAPESVQRTFEATSTLLGVGGVRLAVSDEVRSPLLHGLCRPVVLLPERMTGPEFTDDLPAIFAHELHHAKAHDLAWLGLARLVQILLWPHPLVWRLHAACAAATERATDAAAAVALTSREAYSRSLARVALALAGRPFQSVALAMAIPDIRRRLTALKRESATRAPRRGAVGMASLLALGLLLCLGAFKPVHAEPKIEPKKAQEQPVGDYIVHTYNINEKDGPRIKALIEAILAMMPTDARLDSERKVRIEGNQLSVTGTAEDLRPIDELMHPKLIEGLSNETLDFASFSLLPRGTTMASEQLHAFGNRVVDTLCKFLYPGGSIAQARAEGGQLWLDNKNMKLIIVDTPEQLARVGQYIESLPELGPHPARQDVIIRKHAKAEEPIRTLDVQGVPAAKAKEVMDRYGIKPVAGPNGAEVGIIGFSPEAVKQMQQLEKDALRKKSVDLTRTRVVRVSFGIIATTGGNYDLAVNQVYTEPLEKNDRMIGKPDQPKSQFSFETKFINENTTMTRAQGRQFDPIVDLGMTLQKSFYVEHRDRASSPTLTSIQLPVLASSGKTTNQAFEQKLRDQESAGRIKSVWGPRVTSLQNQEAVFRIEIYGDAKSPSSMSQIAVKNQKILIENDDRSIVAAVVVRVTPDVGKNQSRIHLKDLSVQLITPEIDKLFDELSTRAASDPETARQLKELRARTRKEFDVEVNNGEAILLSAPEFAGRSVLLTPYLLAE